MTFNPAISMLRRFKDSPALQAAGAYAVAATLWIVVSDELVAWLFSEDLLGLQQAQTIKGLVFVALMTGLIYGVVRRAHALQQRNQQVEAMLAVSRKLEVVGSFAANMAHDMANIMTLLGGLTELIKRKQVTGAPLNLSHLQGIEQAVDRAQILLRQMSAFLHKTPEEAQPVDVAQALADADKLLRQAASSRVEFEIKIEAKLPAIRLPRGGLEQALLNLVVNARHAMQDQPAPHHLSIAVARVELRRHTSIFRPSPTSGDFVRIRVADTGRGIAPSEIVKVFEPFYTTKPQGEGTGLGLASVMETFRQHGGWVEVHSVVGSKTVFDLYAPALPPAPPAPATPVVAT